MGPANKTPWTTPYATITSETGAPLPEIISYEFVSSDNRFLTPPKSVSSEDLKNTVGLKDLDQQTLSVASTSPGTPGIRVNMRFTTTLSPTPISQPGSYTVRCSRAWAGTTANCVNPNNLPTLSFSRAEMPYIAENISTAIAAGHPSTLTRATSDDRDANRVAVCGPTAKRRLESAQPPPATISNPSCDEYPFASATQGGADAQTKWVPSKENSMQGSQMSTFLRTNQVQYGDSYKVEVR